MKKQIKRCFLLFICTIALLLPTFSVVAFAAGDYSIEGKRWYQSWIYSEEEMSVPNVVIIYLHGHGNSGTRLEHLERFTRVDHPLKYSRDETLPLPDDTIMICPQSHANGEFTYRQKEISELVHTVKTMYPDAKIILAGHSSGSVAASVMAIHGNDEIDGYVFISGVNPGSPGDFNTIENCMIVFGNEQWLHQRYEFKALYDDVNIASHEYSKVCNYLEENRNNAYVRGPWGHGDAPKVFLEDFFWEWVNNISHN